jgi:hypothetical protein
VSQFFIFHYKNRKKNDTYHQVYIQIKQEAAWNMLRTVSRLMSVRHNSEIRHAFPLCLFLLLPTLFSQLQNTKISFIFDLPFTFIFWTLHTTHSHYAKFTFMIATLGMHVHTHIPTPQNGQWNPFQSSLSSSFEISVKSVPLIPFCILTIITVPLQLNKYNSTVLYFKIFFLYSIL